MDFNFSPNCTSDYELSELYKYLYKKQAIDYYYDKDKIIYNFKIDRNKYNSIELKNIGEHLKWDSFTLHFFYPIRLDFSEDIELQDFICQYLPNLHKYIKDTNDYKCTIGLSRTLQHNYVENTDNLDRYNYHFQYNYDVTRLSIILCMIRKLMFLGEFKTYEDIFVIPGKLAKKYVKVCEVGYSNILNSVNERANLNFYSRKIGINRVLPTDHKKILDKTKEAKFVLNVHSLLTFK